MQRILRYHCGKTVPEWFQILGQPAKRFYMLHCTDYRRTMKPFLIKIPNFWAWADDFCSILQHPVWYIISTKSKASMSKSQIFILDWDLNLGCKELGMQPSCVRSPCHTDLYHKSVLASCHYQTSYYAVIRWSYGSN